MGVVQKLGIVILQIHAKALKKQKTTYNIWLNTSKCLLLQSFYTEKEQ